MKASEISRPSRAEIEHAAQLLRSGQLVAFPTETVYGLGANALDEAAVARIFNAKGRPTSSPVIVHVSSVEMARTVVAEWPESAERLAQRFWPGPLTLVLSRRDIVPALVTAGLDTVGVRMPAHPVALALIEAAQCPVAAPSANRFSQVSPTTAQHVRDGLGDRVDYILDGGPCVVGIESTVLSLVRPTSRSPESSGAPSSSPSFGGRVGPAALPMLLRPGGVSRVQLESVIGQLDQLHDAAGEAHPSPGMHPRHYSPRTRLLLVNNGEVPREGSGAYLQLSHSPEREVRELVPMPRDPAAYAAQLYSTLHVLDAGGYDWIAVDAPPDTPEWEAIRDRLHRAAG